MNITLPPLTYNILVMTTAHLKYMCNVKVSNTKVEKMKNHDVTEKHIILEAQVVLHMLLRIMKKRAFIVSSRPTVINTHSNHGNVRHLDTIGTSESRKLIDTCSLLQINLGIRKSIRYIRTQ